jgi:ubiquinone/menaquinone biosynthesis C-methylase UbiE
VLDQVGIGPGMRCLDVGCGPGEVMRLMAERVGASGQVTGVDNDGRLGREALEVLGATVPGRFEFVHTDVEATEELPGGPFDLVYSRLLLFHLRDPVAMLSRLYAWTRPGGVMLVHDYDTGAIGVWPPQGSASPTVRRSWRRSPMRFASGGASGCCRCWSARGSASHVNPIPDQLFSEAGRSEASTWGPWGSRSRVRSGCRPPRPHFRS